MQQHHRSEILPIAKQLNKFVTLPNIANWRVHERDVLVSGKVVSLFRTKRFLIPDDLSSLKARHTTVTRQGFLVVYEESEHGLIIDLRAASHVLTVTDRFKGRRANYRRSHIKIRLARGNAHLFVRDADVQKWISAIVMAHTRTSRPVVKTVGQQTRAIEDIVEMPKANVDLANSPSTSTNSGLITVIENDGPSSSSTAIASVRKGPMSVKTLRRRLEKKLLMKTPSEQEEEQHQKVEEEPPRKEQEQRFVSSIVVVPTRTMQPTGSQGLFVVPEVIVEEEEEKPADDEEEQEKRLKKEWWTRSLRC